MTVHLHMGEQWIVRVGGKEYGPVDLETLAEWKREGRLLESNEIRRASDAAWTTAGILEDLFEPTPPAAPRNDHPLARRRTFAELVGDSFRVYKSAFVPFFGATL